MRRACISSVGVGGRGAGSYGVAGRLKTQLISGSLVFKVTSHLSEHWEADLTPWVHFIPVEWAAIESDLPAKVRWAIAHDAQAKQIAQAGRRFAVERLHDKETAWYMFQVRSNPSFDSAVGEEYLTLAP